MNDNLELMTRAAVLGAGATAVMDLWAAVLRRFGVKSLDFALLGRWVGHLRDGQWFHASIARAAPVSGELALGWATHYAIGITFASVLLGVFGLEWARTPTLWPSLLIGLVTVIAPLFVLQPALGLGIASSKTATPVFNAFKSVVTHSVYGLGLYATARVMAAVQS